MVDAAQAPRIAVAIKTPAPRDLQSQSAARVFKSGANAIVCALMEGSDGKTAIDYTTGECLACAPLGERKQE